MVENLTNEILNYVFKNRTEFNEILEKFGLNNVLEFLKFLKSKIEIKAIGKRSKNIVSFQIDVDSYQNNMVNWTNFALIVMEKVIDFAFNFEMKGV